MASCNIEKRFCVGCSFRTIEIKKFRPKGNSNCYQRTIKTLKCTSCEKELCFDCVRELISSLKPKMHLLHNDCNDFTQGLLKYYTSNGTVTPNTYIGHCCLIRRHYPTSKHRRDAHHSNLIFKRSHFPTCTKLVSRFFPPLPFDDAPKLRVGGSMCLPEYGLLLPSDENCMDILGLGKEGQQLKAKWHYVIDEEWARGMESRGVRPSTKMPENWISITVKVKVSQPHSLEDRKTPVCTNM